MTDENILDVVGRITLECTCDACPEQYDAFLDGDQVGYLRLRHGYFYASVPDVGGTVVYEAEPNGDGIFENDERQFYLNQAKLAIARSLTPITKDNPNG